MPRLRPVLAALALSLGLLPASLPAPAAAEEVRGELDVTVFYDALAPHGDWVRAEPYGWVWVPEEVDYDWRPYTVGRWAWVDAYGWTWVSDEPWGWAVYHYGRWTWLEGVGWAWVPGTVWAPAWVVFRQGDGWIGWAPRPPEPSWRIDLGLDVGSLNLDFSVGSWGWSFVPVRWFAEPQVRTRIYATVHNPRFLRMTRPATRYAVVEGRVVNRSVDVTEVERVRGTRVTRYRIEDAPDRGARVEGETIRVFRPRLAPRAPAKEPPPKARAGEGASAEAWLEKRRAALKAHLDAPRRAAEADADADAAPPAAPPGTPRPPPGDATERKEAARKALEEERKRAEALLEWQRRRRQGEGTAPPKDAKPPTEGTPPTPPPDDRRDDERRRREEEERRAREERERRERDRGMDDGGMDDRGMDDRGMDDRGMDDRGMDA
jgi:hypothetical protein